MKQSTCDILRPAIPMRVKKCATGSRCWRHCRDLFKATLGESKARNLNGGCVVAFSLPHNNQEWDSAFALSNCATLSTTPTVPQRANDNAVATIMKRR